MSASIAGSTFRPAGPPRGCFPTPIFDDYGVFFCKNEAQTTPPGWMTFSDSTEITFAPDARDMITELYPKKLSSMFDNCVIVDGDTKVESMIKLKSVVSADGNSLMLYLQCDDVVHWCALASMSAVVSLAAANGQVFNSATVKSQMQKKLSSDTFLMGVLQLKDFGASGTDGLLLRVKITIKIGKVTIIIEF